MAGHVPVGRYLVDKTLLQLAAHMQGAGLATSDQFFLLRRAGRALSLPHVLPREYQSIATRYRQQQHCTRRHQPTRRSAMPLPCCVSGR